MSAGPEQLGWAVVTGASSGIGRAFAQALARRRYSVLAVARRRDRLETLAREAGEEQGRIEPLIADLTTADGLASLTRRIAELGSAARLDDELGSIRLNVDAVVALTRTVLPAMVRTGRGAIVNVASVLAFQPLPHFAV